MKFWARFVLQLILEWSHWSADIASGSHWYSKSGWVTPKVQQHSWQPELAAGEKGLWAPAESLDIFFFPPLLQNQLFWGHPCRLPKKLYLQWSWLATLTYLHPNIKTRLSKFFEREKLYMISLPIIKICDSRSLYHTQSNSTVWCLIQMILDKNKLWVKIVRIRGGGPRKIKKLIHVSSHFICWLLHKNNAKRLATRNYYLWDCTLIFTAFSFTAAEAGVHTCPRSISGD